MQHPLHRPLLASLCLLASCALAAEPQPAEPQPANTPPAEAAADQDPAADTEPSAEANIRFQFDEMPYMDALKRFAQMADKPLLLETNLEGTLSFSDPDPYTYDQALDTLNLMLAMKQAMLVESGRYLRLVPLSKLPQTEIPIYRGLEETDNVRPGEVITAVLELKHLDAGEVASAITRMLSNAGSVAPLSRGRGLVLTDRKENIQRVRQLLDKLDSEAQVERQMKTYSLLHSSGATIADLINRTFGESTAPKRLQLNPKNNTYQELSPDPNSYVTAIFDEASRTLVLFGPRDRIELAENLIQDFEDKAGGKVGDVRIFQPRTLQVAELSSMIRQAIPGIAAPDETGSAAATKARLITDPTMNRLIVSAPVAGQIESIENFIAKVDGGTAQDEEGGRIQVTRVLRPIKVDAATAAQVITNALGRRLPNGTVSSPVQLTLDPSSQNLVVTGSPGEVEKAQTLLSQLEAAPAAEPTQQTWFIEVGTEDEAQRLQPLVTQIYEDQIDARPVPPKHRAKISSVGSRLIVTASQPDYQAIEDILQKLQSTQPDAQPRTLSILSLQNTRIDQILSHLTNLVAEKLSDPALPSQPRPYLLPDPDNNRLLVTATPSQVKVVEEVLQTLDVAPTLTSRELAVIPLQNKGPDEVLPLLNQLLQQEGVDPRPDALQPKFTPDAKARQLIVLATPDDLTRIRELINQIETALPAPAERKLEPVQLHRRKAEDLMPLVEKLYSEQLAGLPDPAGGRATLVAETNDNRIMVSGNERQIARVKEIIRQLDPDTPEGQREEVRIIRLSVANAPDLVDLVEQSINAQRQNVQILVEPRSNSLIVSGDPEVVEAAATLIQQLDTRSDREPRELRMIELREADAATLGPLVTDLFTQVMQDEHGPNYTSSTRITPDTTANRLILSGQRDEVEQAALLVGQLDQAPEHSEGARVFPLQNAKASTLAPIVTSALTEYNASGQAIPKAMVSADEQSNSLVVSGSRDNLQDAATIIESLDTKAHSTQRAFRILSVQSDDPTALASLASQILADQNPDASPDRRVTITPQPFGKRLILLGPPERLTEVEALLTALDGTPDAENRSLHLVDLPQANATSLLPLVEDIYQEQSRSNPERPATLYSHDGGRRLAVLGTPQQASTIENIVATLQKETPQTRRQTQVVHVGSHEDAQRLLPIIQQLYEDQVKDLPTHTTPDAQILTDGKTGRLLLSGRPEHLTLLSQIIEEARADTAEQARRITRIFNVGNPAEVERLQPLVEKLYTDQWKDRPDNDPADAQILADAPTGRLIVTGRPDHLQTIEVLITELSGSEAKLEPIDTRVYDLQTANASELVSTLTTLYKEQLKTRTAKPTVETLILADEGVNRLILAGATEELDRLQTLIDKLDQAGQQTAGTRVIQLENARAPAIATVLSTALVRFNSAGTPIQRVSVSADPESNTLVVTGDAEDLQAAAVIAEQLDVAPAVAPRQLHILSVQTGLASELATRVTTLYQEQVKDRPASRDAQAVILGDDTSNRLLVTATQEDLERIQSIVDKLDQAPAETGRQIRVVTLENNSASAISSILSQLFAREIGSTDPARRLILSPAPDDKTLVVDASGPTFSQIESLITKLDSPEPDPDTVIKTVQLTTPDAAGVAEAINTALQNRGTPTKANRVQVTPVESTSSLLLQGPKDEVQEVLQLISELDEGSVSSRIEVRIFELKHGDADQIEDIIRPLFQGMYYSQPRGRGGRRISMGSVSDDQTGKRLIVTGSEVHFQLVQDLLPQLDKAPEQDPTLTTQTVRLNSTDASGIASAINTTLQARNLSPAQRVQVTPVDSAGSLLLQGPKASISEVLQIISELDDEALSTEVEVRVYDLQHGDANEIEDIIRPLFQGLYYSQRRSGSGRGRTIQGYINDDQAGNRLIVTGTEIHFKLVENILPQLDKAPEKDPTATTRTVRLNSTDASGLADAINTTLQARDLPPDQRVQVTPVDSAGSLLLQGPEASISEVLQIISELDEGTFSTEVEVRVYDLQHSDASELEDILQPVLRNMDATQRRRGSGPRLPPANVDDDPAGNRLIITGTEFHFRLIEQLLPNLDKAPDAPSRDIQVIYLENARASDVALQLEQLFEQRPSDEQPFIDYDVVANTLTLIARQADLVDMQLMIEKIDQAALDESIQVRLLPVDFVSAKQMSKMLMNLYPQMHPGTIRIVQRLSPDAKAPPETKEATEEPQVTPDQPPPETPAPETPGSGASTGTSTNTRPEIVMAVDDDANALLVSGPATALSRLEQMMLDLAFSFISTEAEFRQFPLQEADPVAVAKTINELFAKQQVTTTTREGQESKQTTRPPRVVAVADTRTRSVIVSADAVDFPVLESLIQQLDTPGLKPELEYRIVTLTNAMPEKLLPMVTDLGQQLRSLRPGEPVSITADTRSRSLVVIARDKTLEQVEELIRELDIPALHAEIEVLMVPLQKASAPAVVAVLQNLLRPDTATTLTPEARELQEQVRKLRIRNSEGVDIQLDLNKPVKIMADPLSAGANGGNQLILAATPDNLQALVALARQLDQLALTEGVQVRVLPLEHADATTVSQTLSTIFTQGQALATGPSGRAEPDSPEGRALTQPLNVAVDTRSNTLVLSGRKPTLELAERIIADIDRELDHFITEVRLFTLHHASATRLAPMLQAVFDESASPVPGSEGLSTLVTRLQTTLDGTTNQTAQPKVRAAVTIQPDEASNTLIVAARRDMLPLIDDVLQKLDIPEASGMDSIRIIPLENADVLRVQTVINDLFSASKVPNMRPEDRPNVTVDERTNSLIISGNAKAFGIIEGLISQLDSAEIASRTRFQVFSLTNATAIKLQATLQQLLSNRPATIRGQAVEPITIVADALANALVVGAAPEDMGMVQGLIERLDTSATSEPSAGFDILPLAKADAASVAETIQNLYRGGATAGANPASINVDERLNALIVSAGEVDRRRIAELAKKLDTEAVGRISEIRVIQLEHARAQNLSTILNTALNSSPDPLPGQSANVQPLLQFITRTQEGEDLVTSALKERVLITPDIRMNSLIVTGPLDYMPLLEQIIHRLDDASPQPAQIKVFSLLNADARQMADVLTTLFRLQPAGATAPAGQRTVQYTLVLPTKSIDPVDPNPVEVEGASATIGTAEENALTVTVDPRTNSLLIGGAENYLNLAEQIIQSLDSSPVQERVTEVYRLRNAQAPDVETAIRTFLDQSRQRFIQSLGPDAVGAAERLLEREVAITAEPISNSLLMSANPRYFKEIKDLIEQLDQPQPQVLIQSLIAEVIIDATTDLGVEWAYTGSSGSKTYAVGTDFGVEDALQNFGGFSSAITGSDYTFLVRALQNDGRLEILSRPQILTADNQPATINVGQRIPLITNSRVTDEGNVINSFEYQNVGVILTVTPRISPDGFVRMDVGTTNSALSSSGVNVADGLQAPIINERLATTTVSVRSGQSIIIGGLISTTEDERLRKVPVLGDIPLLRYLFRSSEKFEDRKELLIFLTPQVLVKLEEEGRTTDARTMTREMMKKSQVKDELKDEILREDVLNPDVLEPSPTLPPALQPRNVEPEGTQPKGTKL